MERDAEWNRPAAFEGRWKLEKSAVLSVCYGFSLYSDSIDCRDAHEIRWRFEILEIDKIERKRNLERTATYI